MIISHVLFGLFHYIYFVLLPYQTRKLEFDQTVARLVLSNKLHSIEPDVGYSCHTTRERSEQQHNQNLYFWALLAFYHNPSRFRAECIHYLHNPIIHLYYPPKLLHNHCLQFLLGHENVPREVENNAYADFWGIKEMYYGIRASCELIINGSGWYV